MSWKQAWEENRTPWDAGQAAPGLVDLVESGSLPTGRALVPGAGSGYDVLALASPERHAFGLDLAPGAQRRFESLRAERGVPAEQAEIVVADFFDWQPASPFDLIWDYTFLCAIEPKMRPRWAERVDELLAADGEVVTLIFPIVDKAPDDGPPYALSVQMVRDLLEPVFEPVSIEPPARSHPGREGKECLVRWRRR